MVDTPEADVVIVGSGVAGALVAHQLALAGKSVIMLEAGPRVPRWKTVERYRNQVNRASTCECYPSYPWAPTPDSQNLNRYFIQTGPVPYPSEYVRIVGGTTWHWTGNTWRFLPNDFKLKSVYGVGRDWAISYDDLEPYYHAAEVALGCGGDQDYGAPRKQPYPMRSVPVSYAEQVAMDLLMAHDPALKVTSMPMARNSRPYDGRPACCGNNNCTPICPIGAMYNGIVHVEKAEAAGAKLIENAVAYRIEVGPNKKISAILYKDPKGGEHRATGKYFVLACNAIETAKLMLMSTGGDFPNGVGNSSDMVGRNLMDHPKIAVSFYADQKLWAGWGPQQTSSINGFCDGPFRAERSAIKVQAASISPVASETVKIFNKGTLARPAELDRQIHDRAARFTTYNAYHELLPEPTNRVTPSKTQTDAIGIPRPEIYWDINDYIRRSIPHTHEIFATVAKVLGGTEIAYNDTIGTPHHITGTAIMGSDPRDSVVDGDCRSYDHPNLFIAGGAAMASVSTFNVTLTIAALSLRVADRLKREV